MGRTYRGTCRGGDGDGDISKYIAGVEWNLNTVIAEWSLARIVEKWNLTTIKFYWNLGTVLSVIVEGNMCVRDNGFG